MSKSIKLSDELISNAITYGKEQNRSAPKQIEYWAKIGKLVDENPDLPLSFIKGLLTGTEQVKAGDVSEYKFR